MILKSQQVRSLSPEMDPLRMGMGWKEEDLTKPQILIESTYGQSHPGSAHLLNLAQKASRGAYEAGGKGALYFATDICDGMAQGHDGINYSLPSRDIIADLVEIHANATTFDGGVFLASCDKSVPALLMAIGRINIPAVFVTGGVMDAGPDLLTLEQIGKYRPCMSAVRSPRSSSRITSTTHAPPAVHARSWAPRPPCRLWRNRSASCCPARR